MSWFNHPKQVDPPKARVSPGSFGGQADLPERAMAESAQRQAPALPAEVEMSTPQSIEFSVRYSLTEYVHFMWQHAGFLIRRRRIGKLATYYMLVKSTALSAFHFVAQGRSRRIYSFTVDAHGIVRSTTGGVTLIGWEDVLAIRTYSPGYMLVLRRGTLPIPYRCLSGSQVDGMAGYAPWLKGGALR
jgi:hypothetical protein